MKLSRRSLMAGGAGAAVGMLAPGNVLAAVADKWVKPTLWQMETELLLGALPVRNPAVKARRVTDATILRLPGAGRNISEIALNATGRVIWKSCDGKQTVAQIAGRVAQDFECPDDAVYVDTMAFLLHLRMFNAILV